MILHPKSLVGYGNAFNALRLANKDLFYQMTLLLIDNTKQISIKRSIEEIEHLSSFLSNFINLTELNIAHNYKFTDEGMLNLFALTKLQKLDIRRCNISDKKIYCYYNHLCQDVR